jgi:hypothetical protein
MDRAAANAHRVDHRHAARRNVVAVADAAAGLPCDGLAERAALSAIVLHRLAGGA